MVEFLKLDIGLEACYIIRWPQLFNYSLEKRLIPRHYVIKVLKAKGILKKDVDLHNVACASHKRFAERFLDSHKKSIPWLEETYAAACAGQVPPEIKP
jgi:mTERF domain-containing protein